MKSSECLTHPEPIVLVDIASTTERIISFWEKMENLLKPPSNALVRKALRTPKLFDLMFKHMTWLQGPVGPEHRPQRRFLTQMSLWQRLTRLRK